jgi:SAM-dependent methyltransferase
MIAKCRATFADNVATKGWRFVEGSAADLSAWATGTMDFVLFSFNGLDCLPVEDRPGCLHEIFRVLRPGGVILFSAHNLQAVNTLLDPTNPVVDDQRRAALLDHSAEWQGWERANEMLVWDGVYGLDVPLRHLYVRPLYQIRVLEEMGFAEIEAQSAADGKVLDAEQLSVTTEFYIYYRARKPDTSPTSAATENASGLT